MSTSIERVLQDLVRELSRLSDRVAKLERREYGSQHTKEDATTHNITINYPYPDDGTLYPFITAEVNEGIPEITSVTLNANSIVDGDLDVNGDFDVNGDVDLTGNVSLYGDVDLTGNVSLDGDLDQADGHEITTDQVKARDGDGLKLLDSDGDGVLVDDSVISPIDNNDVDLGSTSKRFKDVHIAGEIRLSDRCRIWDSGNGTIITMNAYYDGGYKYCENGAAALIYMDTNGKYHFYNATAGLADAAISWNERNEIDASGNFTIQGLAALATNELVSVDSDGTLQGSGGVLYSDILKEGTAESISGLWDFTNGNELWGRKLQSFILYLRNDGGTLKYRFYDTNFVDRITNASSSYRNVPTIGTSAGFGSEAIGVYNNISLVFNTADQGASGTTVGLAALLRNDSGFSWFLSRVESRNVDGTTRNRPELRMNMNVDTTNIASGDYNFFQFLIWIV